MSASKPSLLTLLMRPRLAPMLAAAAAVAVACSWARWELHEHPFDVIPADPLAAAAWGPDIYTARQIHDAASRFDDRRQVVIVGGSSIVDALPWPDDVARAIAAHGGPPVTVLHLGTSGQTIAESHYALLNLQLAPGAVVYLHVNPGRVVNARSGDFAAIRRLETLPFLDPAVLAPLAGEGAADDEPALSRLLPVAARALRHRLLSQVTPEAIAALERARRPGCDTACILAVWRAPWITAITPVSARFRYDRPPMAASAKRSFEEVIAARWRRITEAELRDITKLLDMLRENVQAQGGALVLFEPPQDPSLETIRMAARPLYRGIIDAQVKKGVIYADYSGIPGFDSELFFDHTHMLPAAREAFTALFAADAARLLAATRDRKGD